MEIVPFQANAKGRLRNMQYGGDNMEPIISRRDFVTIETLDSYQGEGIYVIEIGGCLAIKRASGVGNSILLSSENKLYRTDELPLDHFNDCVVGRILGAWRPLVSSAELDRAAKR